MKQEFAPPLPNGINSGGGYPPLWLAWSVWIVGMTLYLIGFFQRVAPAVMTSELMGAFGISAGGLGGLSASYYYSSVVLQIPTGVLADSWGPRKLLTAGGTVAAAGTILFSLAPDFFWANIDRALIGGMMQVRRGFVTFDTLRARLSEVRSGRSPRLEGEYPGPRPPARARLATVPRATAPATAFTGIVATPATKTRHRAPAVISRGTAPPPRRAPR